jgi:hypothetical protein
MHVIIVKFNAFDFFKILIHSILNFLKRNFFVEKSLHAPDILYFCFL